MRLPWTRGLATVAVALAAAASSLFLFNHAPSVRADCPAATSSPCPANAFLSLDVTMGDANTVINVIGGQFLGGEQLSLYWDTTNKVAGSATADPNGNFNTRVKTYAGDAPGAHRLCASVAPNPCATFTLVAPATTATPSPSPSPSPSPTPTETPSPTASPTSIAAPPSGFDVITKPPFVFLPLAGAAAIALALGFWLFSVLRRPRQAPLPSAAVVHRATRPDYSAGFGSAPAAPRPSAEPSAWPDTPAWESRQATPETPPPVASEPPPALTPAGPPPAATPEPDSDIAQVEWGPPVEWGTGSGDWGFPEPPPSDDPPDPPQPGD